MVPRTLLFWIPMAIQSSSINMSGRRDGRASVTYMYAFDKALLQVMVKPTVVLRGYVGSLITATNIAERDSCTTSINTTSIYDMTQIQFGFTMPADQLDK